MTVTKQQALDAYHGQEFHYTGNHPCRRHVGPRGRVKESFIRVRVSGNCKTWKTRPDEFRLPVKHGLYEHSAIEDHNADHFHRAEDCPLLNT